MSDKTAGTPVNVFRITAATKLVAGGWYDGWTCLECKALLTVDTNLRPGPGPIAQLTPADAHMRITCPHCRADRLYGINERTVRQGST